MTNKKKPTTSNAPARNSELEELNGTIPDADISYEAILNGTGVINDKAFIHKIAVVLGVKPEYVFPLADTIILNKKIQATCNKYGIARNHYYRDIIPKVKDNLHGIDLLRKLIEPHEAQKRHIDQVFFRTLEEKIENGEKWACELWARMTGKIKSAGSLELNIAQQVNVDPAVAESQRKEIITQEIIKLKPKVDIST